MSWNTFARKTKRIALTWGIDTRRRLGLGILILLGTQAQWLNYPDPPGPPALFIHRDEHGKVLVSLGSPAARAVNQRGGRQRVTEKVGSGSSNWPPEALRAQAAALEN